MPVVAIHIGKGRPREIKREHTDAVTKVVKVALDVPPEWVTMIIAEVERQNWAVGGRLQLDKFGPGYGRAGVDQTETTAERRDR
jgi:4-oxalocrotonate tautomerase